jgi:hypothetical protein
MNADILWLGCRKDVLFLLQGAYTYLMKDDLRDIVL